MVIFFTGKPVAVTHSKGRGTVPDSESDLFYEKMQWDRGKMKGSKKGKRTVANPSNLGIIGMIKPLLDDKIWAQRNGMHLQTK